jgi:hypothetical protein
MPGRRTGPHRCERREPTSVLTFECCVFSVRYWARAYRAVLIDTRSSALCLSRPWLIDTVLIDPG